ncbi:MAG: co-chaperone GroES [Acidaminococcaceae bacterium]|mgnify:FL=1|nr:co-chaperone GroES [Acidaminococcaceae bacterium]MDO4935991.1 co-chaperone GroES [Phascolarctobacterium sp.]
MLKPLSDNVLVEVVEQVAKTASGIYLPDTASKEKPQTGKVVAVGDGRLMDNGTVVKVDVAVGDEVLFAKYAGTEVKIEGKDYLLIPGREILAKFEKTAKTKKK